MNDHRTCRINILVPLILFFAVCQAGSARGQAATTKSVEAPITRVVLRNTEGDKADGLFTHKGKLSRDERIELNFGATKTVAELRTILATMLLHPAGKVIATTSNGKMPRIVIQVTEDGTDVSVAYELPVTKWKAHYELDIKGEDGHFKMIAAMVTNDTQYTWDENVKVTLFDQGDRFDVRKITEKLASGQSQMTTVMGVDGKVLEATVHVDKHRYVMFDASKQSSGTNACKAIKLTNNRRAQPKKKKPGGRSLPPGTVTIHEGGQESLGTLAERLPFLVDTKPSKDLKNLKPHEQLLGFARRSDVIVRYQHLLVGPRRATRIAGKRLTYHAGRKITFNVTNYTGAPQPVAVLATRDHQWQPVKKRVLLIEVPPGQTILDPRKGPEEAGMLEQETVKVKTEDVRAIASEHLARMIDNFEPTADRKLTRRVLNDVKLFREGLEALQGQSRSMQRRLDLLDRRYANALYRRTLTGQTIGIFELQAQTERLSRQLRMVQLRHAEQMVVLEEYLDGI